MLELLDIDPVDEPLPPEIESFLTDSDARIEAFFEARKRARRLGFFPSDYPLVYRILCSLRRRNDAAFKLCEWGSGFGVIAGLGAFLGFEACGIEIDPRLISVSRRLMRDYRLEVEILEGSFVPDEYLREERLSDHEALTVLTGAGVNDEVDVEIEDFDVVYAFPWPSEEDLYKDLFARYAADGALLVTYHAVEEVRVYRQRRDGPGDGAERRITRTFT